MRKIIESTLISVDGIFAETDYSKFFAYQDETYLRDGLDRLLSNDAILMGRKTYESWVKIWPGSPHPWAERLNAIPKYVFSSTLETTAWNNSILVRGDVVAEVSRLKQQEGGNLLTFGHGLLGETLLKHHLLDELVLEVHPLILGNGRQFVREGLNSPLKFVAAKSFPAGLVRLTYEIPSEGK